MTTIRPESPARVVDHGPRISGAEYDRRIIALHAEPSNADEREIRRQELEITIDHRLGTRFPRERREALWNAQQAVASHALLTSVGSLFRRALRGRSFSLSDAQASLLIRKYSGVLSVPELMQYFDLPETAIRKLGSD